MEGDVIILPPGAEVDVDIADARFPQYD